jgi:hypothetical protein
VSEKTLVADSVEWKERVSKEFQLVKVGDLVAKAKAYLA